VSQTARRVFAAVVTAIAIGAALWGFSLTDDDEGGPGIAAKSGDSRASPSAKDDRAQGPRVPRLIGLTPAQVRERLDPLGLETEFAQRCEGREPLGRVIRQSPGPNMRVDGRPVYVETDWIAVCSDGEAGPPCGAADLALRIDGFESGHAGGGGSYSEQVEVRNKGDRACQLDADGSVDLASLDGPAEIRGAPVRMKLDVRLDPRELLAIQWQWTNWCHPQENWAVTAELAGLKAIGRTGAPVCFDRDDPSLLHGPTVMGS
jgi:hypothetical protein